MSRPRLTLADAQAYAVARGGICLSDQYQPKQKLRFRCADSHEWESELVAMRASGSWCSKCHLGKLGLLWRAKRTPISDLHAYAQSHGGICLSEAYSTTGKQRFRCAEGHEWESRFASMKHTKSWCSICSVKRAAKARLSKKDWLGELHSVAKSRGGECLASEYLGGSVRLGFACADGHQWEARPNDIKQGTWCPKCANKTEALVRQFLECVLEMPFPLTKCDWLADPHGRQRQIDGFNEAARIAFEYHGEQHYQHINHFHGPRRDNAPQRGLVEQMERDDFVRAACKKAGVTLIEIPMVPDGYSQATFIAYLVGILAAHGFVAAPERIDAFRDMAFHVSKLQKYQQIAQEKGGRLLSRQYLGTHHKHSWECAEGHRWDAVPKTVSKGVWCPYCSKCRRLDPLGEARQIAISKGGVLLSTEYKNQKSSLAFLCKENHHFEITGGSLFNQGSWCRFCAGRELIGATEDLRSFAQSKGGALVAGEYKNADSIVRFRCAHRHEWDIKAGLARNRKSWCKVCATKANIAKAPSHNFVANDPIGQLRSLAQEKGGSLLTTHYENESTKVRFRCVEGHEWDIEVGRARRTGSWCRKCATLRNLANFQNNRVGSKSNNTKSGHTTARDSRLHC